MVSNGGGGSSIIFYSEINSPKESRIDITSNNKLSVTETNTVIKNNIIDI